MGGELIYSSRTHPAVQGVLAPTRTDWGKVLTRAFWALVVSGLIAVVAWVAVISDWLDNAR